MRPICINKVDHHHHLLKRQRVDFRRIFYFDMRIAPEVRGFCESVFDLRMVSDTLRYGIVDMENGLYPVWMFIIIFHCFFNWIVSPFTKFYSTAVPTIVVRVLESLF